MILCRRVDNNFEEYHNCQIKGALSSKPISYQYHQIGHMYHIILYHTVSYQSAQPTKNSTCFRTPKQKQVERLRLRTNPQPPFSHTHADLTSHRNTNANTTRIQYNTHHTHEINTRSIDRLEVLIQMYQKNTGRPPLPSPTLLYLTLFCP